MKQKVLLFLALALGMRSTLCQGQTREYQVGDDGYEWYRVSKTVNGVTKYGAEDRYGNMIVPTEYDSYVFYIPEIATQKSGFIGSTNNDYYAWYNKNGKCIIPFTREYTRIQKYEKESFGTYYTFVKSGACGLCDKNGREVLSVKMDGVAYVHPVCETIKGQKKYGLYICLKNLRDCYADANGKIIVPPEFNNTSKANVLARNRLTTTNNPLAGNKHETLAEAEGRSSGGFSSSSSSNSASSSSNSSSNSNTGNNTQTIHVQHHRDPVPVQVWIQCNICYGSGICQTINCNNGWNNGTRMACLGCGGSGRCGICGGHGGHYEVQYR